MKDKERHGDRAMGRWGDGRSDKEARDRGSIAASPCRPIAPSLFDAQRLRARMAALQDDAADDKGQQAVNKARFPLHNRLDFDARRRLRAVVRVEAKDHQRRGIEWLVDGERVGRAQPAVAGAQQAKVVAFGHLDAQAGAVRVGARALDQERFAAIFGSQRNLFIERPNIDVEAQPLSFIDGATLAAPAQPCNGSAVDREEVPDAAVAFAPHENLGLAEKVVLKGFARRRAEYVYTCLHRSVVSGQWSVVSYC